MSNVKQKLAQAVEALQLANKLQQEAFAEYNGALPEDEDICYQIHNEIENIIEVIEEVTDAVEEVA